MADENENQKVEAASAEVSETKQSSRSVEDPVLARLLEQERELERLRRYNERLRRKICETKQKAQSEAQAPEQNQTASSNVQARHTYAARFYNLLRRDYGN